MKVVSLILGVFLIQLSFSQPPKSRALIIIGNSMVMSPCTGCGGPNDWYNTHYKNIFSEWNNVYTNSGINASVEIAGVIWDKTYAGNTVQGSLTDLSNPAHPDLGKYHSMLDEYSADYLILHSWSTGGSGNGVARQETPPIGTPATFWTDNPNAHPWIHEAGHKHEIGHCHGYRQTYDANNNPVTAGGVSGFHTVMQYKFGATTGRFAANGPDAPCNINYVGSTTQESQFTMTFADPTRSYVHNGISRALGVNPDHSNVVSTVINRDNTIRILFTTPTNIELNGNFNVDELEYSNFLATNQVTIRPGFQVNKGTLRIQVGSNILPKRGVSEDNYRIDEENGFDKYPESVQEFKVSLSQVNKELLITIVGSSSQTSKIAIFDSFGKQVGFEVLPAFTGKYSRTIGISHINSGFHYIRLDFDGKRLYRRVRL